MRTVHLHLSEDSVAPEAIKFTHASQFNYATVMSPEIPQTKRRMVWPHTRPLCFCFNRSLTPLKNWGGIMLSGELSAFYSLQYLQSIIKAFTNSLYIYISNTFSAGFSFIITSLFFFLSLSQRPFHSFGMSTSWGVFYTHSRKNWQWASRDWTACKTIQE